MILIIAASDDGHLPYVLPHLDALGATYQHFDPQDFTSQHGVSIHYEAGGAVQILLYLHGRALNLASVGAVWNRARVRPRADQRLEPDQQWWASETATRFLSELYECVDCLWLPERPASEREPFRATNPQRKSGGANPTRQQQASPHNKLHQLRLAGQLGMRVPRTIITNQIQDALDFYEACAGNIISKRAISLATWRHGERVQCFTKQVTRRDLRRLQTLPPVPVVFQENIAKQSELRVTIVGEQIFAAEIASQEHPRLGTDWRHYPEFGGERYYRQHCLPPELAQQCLQICAKLGLSFAALDLILTPHNEYVFLEVNPGGQWAWIERYTDLPIGAAIAHLLHTSDCAHQKLA